MKIRKFQLFRLSLTLRMQDDLIDKIKEESREKFLRRLLENRLTVRKRRQNFEYVPISQENRRNIVARIGKTSLVMENLPPDQMLEETVRPSWKAAYIVIDPTSHNDGQKISIEETLEVGKPKQILRSIVDTMNSDPSRKYQVDFEPIQSISDFWEFAEENEGRITSLKFEFIAPNMWDSENELEDELREMRQAEQAHRINLELKNPDGLETDTNMVRSGVSRVEHGGGNLKARARGRKRYDSTKKIAQTFLEEANEEGDGLYYQVSSSMKNLLDQDEK